MINPEPIRPAPDAIDRLITLLATERDYTSIEVAETLWLATKIEPVATVPAEAPVSDPLPVRTEPVGDLPPLPEPSPLLEVQAPTPRANLTLPSPQPGVLPPTTLPVWVADPSMLTNPLEIIRALQPLRQKLEVGVGKRLDEAATVDEIARTQLCLPILAPEQRPYFDLVVVVDRSASMHIWQRLIKDIVRIFKRYGLFWNVQVYDLMVDPDACPPNSPVTLISNPQRPGHRPSELIDQQGQRIVVVLSDCAATYWWDGTLLSSLNAWGAAMPTVVWQMLPTWMWRRTALGQGTAAAFSSDRYGVANSQLTVQIQEYEDPQELQDAATARRLPLPVVTSEVGDLAQWSAMVGGDRRQTPPGFVLPSQGGPVPRTSTYAELASTRVQPTGAPDADLAAQQQALDGIARTRVERFLELASPAAQRLVMLLAAAPVITLPVVRLIRDSMLNDVASPLPVAEVFLSGLLQRLPGQATSELEQVAQAEPTPEALSPHSDQQPLDTQDLVQYDFAPRVRQVLLEFLPPVETIDVINSVSAAVEQRWNQVSTEDFRAFLTDPTIEVPEALQNTKSFASVTADILAQLGPEYDEFAQTLRRGTAPPPPPGPGGFDPNDFPLQDIEYEVAEFINFPTLEPFEFIEAYFEEETILPLSHRDVQFLLKPNNPQARSLLAFIQRTINQFGMQAYITEVDIFVEVYLRGVSSAQQLHKHLLHPRAWMRRTAYNIIRECKRDRLCYSVEAFNELMDQSYLDSAASYLSEVEDSVISEAIAAVLQAVDSLSPSDRSLIQWRVVEGLSWQEVQTRRIAEGEDRVSQATLRKRSQRALERLRRAFHFFVFEPGSSQLEDGYFSDYSERAYDPGDAPE